MGAQVGRWLEGFRPVMLFALPIAQVSPFDLAF